MQRPFSQACENNKQPILGCLQELLAHSGCVLEIGSGSGQHAAFFSQHMPHLRWQPTDLNVNIEGIQAWADDCDRGQLLPPLELDVRWPDWSERVLAVGADSLFTANSLHIMAWEAVCSLFDGCSGLPDLQRICVYGPFNKNGAYTSDSNARFDQWLAEQSPHSAIRDLEAVDALAVAAGFEMGSQQTMPANNLLLEWRRVA